MTLEALYGPAGAEAIRYLRRPRMDDVRFALLRKPTDPHCKVEPFATLADLVAAIHAARRGDTIHTIDAKVAVQGRDEPLAGVAIWAVNKADEPRYLGWAYLEGRNAQALRRALERAHPDLPVVGKAA